MHVERPGCKFRTFVVTTNTNDDTPTAEDVALGYRHLLPVEESWRELERGIRLRPVYHWVAHRIHTHVRLWAT